MTQVLLNSHFFQASPSPIICQNKLIKLNYQRERESTLNMVWSKPSMEVNFRYTIQNSNFMYCGDLKGRKFSNFSSHLFCPRLRKFRQSLTPSPPLPLLALPSCTTPSRRPHDSPLLRAPNTPPCRASQ